ncbi:hypothetical protein [Crassaminicella profunda]|uniref:hypothetical protein n=1 Tax=Crassaminicella profunda TaxID=1286698 RepID=UPI001CA6EAE5|nr:hypothetical protein [Crassaminicella profunda]QZY56679.1 hypothetical protein K7H06_07090 [Crassaminicella profunda]
MFSTSIEDRLVAIIQEHTDLAEEYAKLPLNGGATVEEAAQITKRKSEIKNRIEELRSERQKLFEKWKVVK